MNVTDILCQHRDMVQAVLGNNYILQVVPAINKLLPTLKPSEIFVVVDAFNATGLPLKGGGKNRDLTDLRKIFCLLCDKAGIKHITAAFCIHIPTQNVPFHIMTGKSLLCNNPAFRDLYDRVEAAIMERYADRLEALKASLFEG